MTTYRILSIDGGGIKGVFPASFLASVEDIIGDKVSNYFDLIVGTSTGGIIALALGLGFSAKEILKFYEELCPLVFKGNRFARLLRQLVLEKYDPTPLRESLVRQFGSRRLGESNNRLVVPSFNLETGKVHVYKTCHHPRFDCDYKDPVVDIAMATAAAPTYFPTYRSAMGIPLIDGGIWANNPTGFAVIEAISILEWPRNSLNILSLGCTSAPIDATSARGRLDWMFKIAEVYSAAQSSSSMSSAQLLIGLENITRVDPIVSRKKFDIDNKGGITSLKGLGNSEARKTISILKGKFFASHAQPFVPCHKL